MQDKSNFIRITPALAGGARERKPFFWDEEVSGDKFKGEITWNGKFKDGTIAPPGEYLVWIKAKDKAGNERFGLGRVIVPQPTVFSLLQPTITNNQETLLPPKELFDDDELSNASSATPMAPQTSFGGSTTDPKETTQNSLSLAAGTASASTATNSNILWGATAAALIGWATATALEEKKKRKEQEQAQISEISLQREKAKTRANRDEEPPMTRQEKELAKQRKELQKLWDANGAAIYEANREYKAKHGKEMDATARSKAIKDATMNGVFNAGAYASNLEAEKTRRDAQNERMANKMTRVEKEEEVRWQEQQKAAEEKKKAQDLQDGLAAYYAATRQGKQEAKPNWWEQTKSFVQEKIVQPYIRPIVTVLDEKVYQPYLKPAVAQVKATQTYQTLQSSLIPKKIITTALTLAIGVNTVQWVNNLKSNPDVFLPARTQAQSLIEELRINYPPAPEKHSLSYIASHPYDVLATGSDYLNALTSIGASYADAIWQQNPLTQLAVESLETLEDSLCSRVTSQAWANRCTAAFYLGAGLTATPFDTTLGVANSFIVDPIVGFLKQGALNIETYTTLPDLVTAIRDEGWEGAKDFVSELWTNRMEIILNDKQLQSAFFVEGLILLALIAAPVAGGVILGMTANSLMELDAAVTASKNKKSLIEFVTSHEVRTTVVSSALILTMIAAGVGNKALEFRAFQERLSPSAQASFQTLSLLEQTRLADLAVKLKLSPGAMEFYLAEVSRPGSPLTDLPLTDALRVSNLAAESGRGSFILDYVGQYGYDTALKNTSPKALNLYVNELKHPESPLHYATPQDGLYVSSLVEQNGNGQLLFIYVGKYGVTGALRLATPEVIKGMTSDQFLVQAQEMLTQNTGYNVSPESWFTEHPSIGKNGTFITNKAAIETVLGKFEGKGKIQISPLEAATLEEALGLERGSLSEGFRISTVADIDAMQLVFPVDVKNPRFLGAGKGLPGGGTEIIMSPSLPVNSPFIIEQVIVEVVP